MKAIAGAVVLALLSGATGAASTIETAGGVGAVALPAGAAVMAAARKDGKGTLQLVEAYAATMAIVYVLKPTINRTRPDGGSQSFPSGHSASAFAGAAFLERRYGWSIGAPAYALATFVAVSRVEAKRHYTTDVVAGGAIGILSNLVFTRRYQKVAVTPAIVPRTAGVTFELSW